MAKYNQFSIENLKKRQFEKLKREPNLRVSTIYLRFRCLSSNYMALIITVLLNSVLDNVKKVLLKQQRAVT